MYSDSIYFIISDLGSGGAQRVIVSLSNFWVNQNRQVTIVCLESDLCFYAIDNRVSIKLLNTKKTSSESAIFKSVFNNISKIIALRTLFKRNHGAVFISFIDTTNVISVIASLFLGIRLIISDRNNLSKTPLPKGWVFLRKYVYRYASLIILQTRGVVKEYDLLKIKLPLFRVIHNPIYNLPQQRDLSCKENFILAVGRLHTEKGFDKLIAAYHLAKVNWPLVIVGEGNERGFLEEMVKKKGLRDVVTLLGNSTEIESFYSRASIFTLTSVAEGMPNALLEAMAHGCAVISMNCPYGPDEIITHGVNGLLIENGNVEDFAVAIHQLVTDEAYRMQLSKKAFEIIDKHRIEEISKIWLENFSVA